MRWGLREENMVSFGQKGHCPVEVTIEQTAAEMCRSV